MKYILIAVLSLILTACVETTVQSQTDPEFKGSKVSKIVIDLSALPLQLKTQTEPILIEQLKAAGVQAVNIRDVAPATRDYTPDQLQSIIAGSGYEAIMFIQMTDSGSRTSYAGSINNTSYTGNFNGNQFNMNSSGISTPLILAMGNNAFKATLYDNRTGRKIWIGELDTQTRGTAFVGKMGVIASSAVQALVSKLKEDGRI